MNNRITVATLLALAAGSAVAHSGHAGSWLPGHGHSDLDLLAAGVVGALWLALAAGALVVGLRRLLARR
jgi:hypothetical protein